MSLNKFFKNFRFQSIFLARRKLIVNLHHSFPLMLTCTRISGKCQAEPKYLCQTEPKNFGPMTPLVVNMESQVKLICKGMITPAKGKWCYNKVHHWKQSFAFPNCKIYCSGRYYEYWKIIGWNKPKEGVSKLWMFSVVGRANSLFSFFDLDICFITQ